MIERHFTLDKQQKGTDHKLSLEPAELQQLIARIRWVEKHLPDQFGVDDKGDDQSVIELLAPILSEPEMMEVKLALAPVQRKEIQLCEMECRLKLGKSLVYRSNLIGGTILSGNDICAKVNEPFGLSAEKFDEFVGKTLTQNVLKDDNLTAEHFQN